jgi:lipopolysaccharide/colanic/teichoic acid biosynthesis glycosyltransferase
MALDRVSMDCDSDLSESHFPVWKRSIDLLASSAGLVVLSPAFAIIAAVIKLDSAGPVFFRQERVGFGLSIFSIYKFRTMVADAPRQGKSLTASGDSRITRVGRFLRKTKIDELPQLINVLRGEMTLVGPRPEVPKYVNLFRQDYAEILKIRPGVTDLASLKYRNESDLLARTEDPEREYILRVLPDKIALAKEYVRRSSLPFDISLIVKTVAKTLAG